MLDAFAILTKPVTILVGHFGSGKSELALHLAFGFRQRGPAVTLADLDVVKPYFRCRLLREDLAAAGIELVAPGGEHFYADLPIVIPAMHGAVARANRGTTRTVLDVGGDDSGARVLGSLATVLDRAKTEVLFVVNTNRPFAEDVPRIRAMLREIEGAAGLPVTGLVANTHLMDETDLATVRAGLVTTRALALETGLPVRFGAALARLISPLYDTCGTDFPWLAIDRRILAPHVRRQPGSRRSLAV